MDLPPIVDAGWALDHRDDVVLADVRWYLDGRSGREAFVAAHIPGATFVDLERDLSAPGPETEGRHPLPTPEAFAAAMGRLGIGADVPVVAYDDAGGGTSGRLAWMLRILGRPAAILDGGLHAWPEPPEAGEGTVRPPVAVEPVPWPADRFVDHTEVARATADPASVVLDARSAPRFRGEGDAVDARPGHIPGAANAPWAANLDPESGRFRGANEQRERYARLGIEGGTDVVCYCGSGVSACADLLALEQIGVARTKLYVPSWSGWSADPERPAAIGGE